MFKFKFKFVKNNFQKIISFFSKNKQKNLYGGGGAGGGGGGGGAGGGGGVSRLYIVT